MAVSMMSQPASTAFRQVMNARPAVQWVCSTTGRSTASLMADTRSYASFGEQIPAMSLMQMVETPICCSSFTIETYFCSVCTGLVV